MTEAVTIRGVSIGTGRPKICVPITASSREAICRKAGELSGLPFDLVEWRADWHEAVEEQGQAAEVLKDLRNILGDVPILFTFRSKTEGGERELDIADYLDLNRQAAASGCADLVDLELMTGLEAGEDCLRETISFIKAQGAKVLMSSHDFDKTPCNEELIRRLFEMDRLGADILKEAVMPQDRADVLRLLTVTEQVSRQVSRPLVTMAMGGLGAVSRLTGEAFGSAITFGSAGVSSAPGQMDVRALHEVLQAVHAGMAPKTARIFLIGFMGTGKTTVSSILSQNLFSPVIEMDQRIERESSMKISDIFEKYGEEYFRDLETELIRTLSEEKPAVISCGGGAVLRKENVEMMRKAGTIVLLTARPETVLKRVWGDNSRPNLKGRMTIEGIQELMDRRRSVYEEAAELVIETDGKKPEEIAGEILGRLGRK